MKRPRRRAAGLVVGAIVACPVEPSVREGTGAPIGAEATVGRAAPGRCARCGFEVDVEDLAFTSPGTADKCGEQGAPYSPPRCRRA